MDVRLATSEAAAAAAAEEFAISIVANFVAPTAPLHLSLALAVLGGGAQRGR